MSDPENIYLDNRVNSKVEKSDFLDYLSILMKWRKFIVFNFIIVTCLSIIVSLLLPKWYKATASILPPKQPDLFGSLSSATSVLKNISGATRLGGFRQNSDTYNYLAILKSRQVAESVVKKFDLVTIYDISDHSLESTVKELRDNVSFDVQDEGYITIDVYDKSSQRAADMANFFVEVLNNLSIQLSTQEATNNREFVEKRVYKSKDDLKSAEEALRSYQEHSGMIIMPDQNSTSIYAVAELYGMKAKKEIELAVLERTVSQNSESVQQLKIELNELNKKLSTVPLSGMESYRLYRDVVVQQKIVEFLIPIYEQAKVEEQKNIPVLLVLDKAVPPEKKDKPKRVLLVGLAMGGALAVNLIFIIILEFISRSGIIIDIRRLFSHRQVPMSND